MDDEVSINIAMVQFNPVLGALNQNVERMFIEYQKAADKGAELVIFPEMAVTGYPIEDLAESESFLTSAERAAKLLVSMVKKDNRASIIFGCTKKSRGKPHNAAWIYDRATEDTTHSYKFELPNYGVFDEKRIFAPSSYNDMFWHDVNGLRVAVMICEDIWHTEVPKNSEGEVDLIVAINGSPYEIGKQPLRRDIARKAAIIADAPIVYCNLVGGQDELVFDGGSFAYDGTLVTQFTSFEEGIFHHEMRIEEWSRSNARDYDPIVVGPDGRDMDDTENAIADIYRACVLGLRDYLGKQSFESVVLGMSGGVDSGIVAAIAVDALGADKVHLVRLPSKFSSGGSLDDALAANDRLGTKMRTIPIEPVVDALRAAYAGAGYDYIVEKDDRPELEGVADENIQARARGTILMAISNQEGHMVLTTGNKSEVSVGYSTLYGDMSGGFNPIKDCYKTTVWDLCRYRNALNQEDLDRMGFLGPVAEVVPEEIIVKPPSAELREDQQDSDSLPDYETLDGILVKMIEEAKGVEEIVRAGYLTADVQRVRGLVDRAEYKRRQAAPGVKITSKLHGRDRRVPIVNHFGAQEVALLALKAEK